MDDKEYLVKKILPIMENLIFQLYCDEPKNPIKSMIDILEKIEGNHNYKLSQNEKDEIQKIKDIITVNKENN